MNEMMTYMLDIEYINIRKFTSSTCYIWKHLSLLSPRGYPRHMWSIWLWLPSPLSGIWLRVLAWGEDVWFFFLWGRMKPNRTITYSSVQSFWHNFFGEKHGCLERYSRHLLCFVFLISVIQYCHIASYKKQKQKINHIKIKINQLFH